MTKGECNIEKWVKRYVRTYRGMYAVVDTFVFKNSMRVYSITNEIILRRIHYETHERRKQNSART